MTTESDGARGVTVWPCKGSPERRAARQISAAQPGDAEHAGASTLAAQATGGTEGPRVPRVTSPIPATTGGRVGGAASGAIRPALYGGQVLGPRDRASRPISAPPGARVRSGGFTAAVTAVGPTGDGATIPITAPISGHAAAVRVDGSGRETHLSPGPSRDYAGTATCLVGRRLAGVTRGGSGGIGAKGRRPICAGPDGTRGRPAWSATDHA